MHKRDVSVPPARQLAGFIARFTPEIASLARASVAKMRKRLPGALVLVYDNYNALAVGFGPSERASEALFSIAVFPRSVALCFLWGIRLKDPQRLLKGGGNQIRNIRLENASDLDKLGVKALMTQALATATKPIPSKGRSPIVIKSISAKQRPRRPQASSGK